MSAIFDMPEVNHYMALMLMLWDLMCFASCCSIFLSLFLKPMYSIGFTIDPIF